MTAPPVTDRTGPTTLIAVAAAGSAVTAVASWWCGATPVWFAQHRPALLSWCPNRSPIMITAFYLGMAAFTLAWLLLGRLLLSGDRRATPRTLRHFVTAGALPMIAAAPFGRDLWAYAAQGNLLIHGVDPYRHGPSAVPSAYTAEVSHRWVGSSAPYGPVWLRLSQAADHLTGGSPTGAALLLRLPELLGLALCVWAVGQLAERLPTRSVSRPLWLGLASPLMIFLGVGGGHNDLIMLGLGLAGVALAARPGLRWLVAGAALATVATLVKSPAVVTIAFTVPVWPAVRREPPARVLRACAVVAATALAVTTAVTLISGLGLGWTRQVNSSAPWVSWLSLPSAVGMVIHAAQGRHVTAVDDTMRACRTIGEVATVLLLVALWLAALRRRPIGVLALAFAVSAFLAPAVQPWYFSWAIVPAGLVLARRGWLVAIAAAQIVLTFMVAMDGSGMSKPPWAPLLIVAALAATWWLLPRRTSPPGDHRPDDTLAEMGAEHRAQLGDVQLPQPRH